MEEEEPGEDPIEEPDEAEDGSEAIEESWPIFEASPNPFNPYTTIRYTLPSAGHVSLAVYDAKGRVMKTLVDRVQAPGQYSRTWDGRDETGRAVASGDVEAGLCVCGTGIGIAMAANKIAGVRAATVHDATSARLAREHNDANVLCIGERLLGPVVAADALDAWMYATFEGGRHVGRVAKLDALGGESVPAAG